MNKQFRYKKNAIVIMRIPDYREFKFNNEVLVLVRQRHYYPQYYIQEQTGETCRKDRK